MDQHYNDFNLEFIYLQHPKLHKKLDLEAL